MRSACRGGHPEARGPLSAKNRRRHPSRKTDEMTTSARQESETILCLIELFHDLSGATRLRVNFDRWELGTPFVPNLHLVGFR